MKKKILDVVIKLNEQLNNLTISLILNNLLRDNVSNNMWC